MQFIHQQNISMKAKEHSIISMFLELRKAFDIICHKKLLEKLDLLGTREKAYRL